MKYGTLVRLNDLKDCDKSFAAVKELGLNSCQLVYKPDVYCVEDAQVIKKSANKYGIEISALFAGFKDDYTVWDIKYDYRNAGINSVAFGAERIKYLISAMPFVKELGVTDMITHAGFIPNDPFCEEYAEMVCKVSILASNAKKHGLNLLFETGGESPITLLRIIKEINTGNLFVNLDTGNLIMYGYGNPCDAVITIGDYVRNVHAKDGVPPTDPYKIGAETAIGKGVVDFKRVFTLLKEKGYDRFVTIEREITGEEQKKDIKNGLDYVKNIIESL